MDKVTQENASLVEESATSAQALQDQADQLADMVSAFTLHGDMQGPAHGTQADAAPLAHAGWARTQTLS
jgi:methyl-accepting chemotaxis protein